MRGLGRLILSLCEVAEAEGALLRRCVQLTGLGCGLVALGMLFLAAALILVLAAAYHWLDEMLPPEVLYLLLGAVSLCIALFFFWSGRKCSPGLQGSHQAPKQ